MLAPHPTRQGQSDLLCSKRFVFNPGVVVNAKGNHKLAVEVGVLYLGSLHHLVTDERSGASAEGFGETHAISFDGGVNN